MSIEDQIRYHSTRAMRELDQGLSADSPAAARAHLELSSLHLQRARALGQGDEEPRPSLLMG